MTFKSAFNANAKLCAIPLIYIQCFPPLINVSSIEIEYADSDYIQFISLLGVSS